VSVGLKRIIASIALVLGLGGFFAFTAPSASANPIIDHLSVIIDPFAPGPCVGIHLYLHGSPLIETGRPGICL